MTLLDIYPHPSDVPPEAAPPWPEAPKRLANTYSLDEGGQRLTRHRAQRLRARDGRVAAVEGSRVGPPPDFAPVAASEFELPADLVLVAIGFAHPEHDGLVAGLELELDRRGNLATREFATSRPGVFAAGDARVGQSLVVTAIAEGRDCALAVDRYLSRALGDGATGAVAAQTS